jgi:hypothetical protein
MTQPARRYTVRFIAAMFAYAMLLISINLADRVFELPQPLRIAMSLLPVLPVIAMVFIALAFIRSIDEFQRRTICEAALLSTLILCLACFTWGFLEGAMSLPDISLIWVLPAFLMLHALVMPLVRSRYA